MSAPDPCTNGVTGVNVDVLTVCMTIHIVSHSLFVFVYGSICMPARDPCTNGVTCVNVDVLAVRMTIHIVSQCFCFFFVCVCLCVGEYVCLLQTPVLME